MVSAREHERAGGLATRREAKTHLVAHRKPSPRHRAAAKQFAVRGCAALPPGHFAGGYINARERVCMAPIDQLSAAQDRKSRSQAPAIIRRLFQSELEW